MDIGWIAMNTIYVGRRQRPTDEQKVADIAASIEQVGLLQPIGVVALPEENIAAGGASYRLVFGNHRLQAMDALGREEIAAYVLPSDLPDEAYLLMELQENSARNDLTGAQLKGYAAEIGRLVDILAANGHEDNVHGFWLDELSTKVGVDRRTLLRWWQTFCQEQGQTLTPRKALDVDKQQFYDWLEDQKRQDDEAKQQQADARKRQIQHEECESAITHLANLAQMYGVEVVERQVITVFQERFRLAAGDHHA